MRAQRAPAWLPGENRAYHHDLDGFINWLDRVEQSDAVLHNPAGLVRSLLDKSTLKELGFRTPATLAVKEFDLDAVGEWVGARGFDQVVVKPAWGASGHGVKLVASDELAAMAERWRADPVRRPMLVQEFVPEVRNGEVALVFFAGQFSHALLRQAAPGDFRVNGRYGGSMALLPDVKPSLIEFGAKVEAALVARPTYARIDVVSDGDNHTVMEVEVNEPALGLDLAPGAAARFAAALVD